VKLGDILNGVTWKFSDFRPSDMLSIVYLWQAFFANAKMSSFSITRKKTPFQKHREEEEAKKKVGLMYPIYLVLVEKTYTGCHNLVVSCRERKMRLLACMLNL
jgi:hypothetical protein